MTEAENKGLAQSSDMDIGTVAWLETELNERLELYICQLSVTASGALYSCLMELRKQSSKLADDRLRILGAKAYSDAEYAAAVKEILCIWLHLEAIEQGGDQAAGWLLAFLRKALLISDLIIAQPKSLDVMHSHENHTDTASLCQAAAQRACRSLGFGEYSPGFAYALKPAFSSWSLKRRQVLKDALTLPVDSLRSWQALNH